MARGDWMIRNELGVTVRKWQQIERDGVSPRVFSPELHGAARDFGFCGGKKPVAAAGRAWQVAELQRQCRDLYSDMDVTLPLYWESMGRNCRSSLNALEFEFNKAHAAQQAELQRAQRNADTGCVDSHADHDLLDKGQMLSLHLIPRPKLVQTFSNEKRSEVLQEGDSSFVTNVEAQGTDIRGTTSNDLSPACRSRIFQPRYSKLGLKSLHAGAPVDTLLKSRSSSFRGSQSSGGAWETSGDKDSGVDSCSSRDSTASLQDSMSCFNGNHDQYMRVSTEDPNDFKPHQPAGFPKDCSKDFYSYGKPAAEIRTSALSTLLRPWKLLFGSKKFSTKHRSKEAEHIDNGASRLLDAYEAPIISWSAPLQKTSALSPVKNQKVRDKNIRRMLPYFAQQAPFTAASTTAAAAEEKQTSAFSEKNPTQRLLRRESSLRIHETQNSSSLLPGISNNTSNHADQTQKPEPRLMHSQSATMNACTSASPRGGSTKPENENGPTPTVVSTERWKKYVKMLNPLYPGRRFTHTQEAVLRKSDNTGRITLTALAPAKASLLGSTTPSRKTNHGMGTDFPASKMNHLASSETYSSTKAIATSSKLSRIIASSVKTPKSKSVFNPNKAAGSKLAAQESVKHRRISEQHNAVQGAIAHCKESHSGQLNSISSLSMSSS